MVSQQSALKCHHGRRIGITVGQAPLPLVHRYFYQAIELLNSLDLRPKTVRRLGALLQSVETSWRHQGNAPYEAL